MLDPKNRVVGVYDIGRGSKTSVSTSPSEALKAAILTNCTGLILAHNHPSGDTTPSSADIQFTEKMEKAASLMDIMLHDHIIIGNNHYSSLRNMGYLNGV